MYIIDQEITPDNPYKEHISRLQSIFKKTPRSVIEELLKSHGFDQAVDILLNEAQATVQSPTNSSDEVSTLVTS